MDQTIQFVTASDGVRLAYARSGSGPPLLKTANWLNHVEFDWQSPVFRHWFAALSANNQFHRYDARGCGLSDWVDHDLSFERQVADLECVVDASGIDRFALLALSQGGAVAVEYCRTPSRSRHPPDHPRRICAGLGADAARSPCAPAARSRRSSASAGARTRPLSAACSRSCSFRAEPPEQLAWFDELMHRTTRPEIAARIVEAFGDIDVTSRLADVRAATLITHSRGDARIPLDQGRMLAAGIPQARFVELDSAQSRATRARAGLVPIPGGRRRIPGLADGRCRGVAPPTRRASTMRWRSSPLREREILALVAGGAANQAIADKLFISEKTVRNHLTAIFDKLGVCSRAGDRVRARPRNDRRH